MRSPYIHENIEEYEIIGSAEALTALGEMLISKAKIGKNFLATFSDSINKPIKIILDTDLLKDEN